MLLSTEASSWELEGHNEYGAENKGVGRCIQVKTGKCWTETVE